MTAMFDEFRALHRPGDPLVLPNAWDFASAAALVDAGFRAVATTSLGVAAAASRLVASLLFGLAPTDAATMLIAMTIMLIVSALAGYLPARRAVRVDPMVALHYE